ncbi:MAG: F0F1 ATP synthase subunit delta [Odoribacter sp.]|nr:F0F1 ATP synthase subunit delta [Odoribacter sp.]
MNQGLIPRRYAKALFKTDKERGDAERCYQLMNTLVASFDANPQLQATIANPFIATPDKVKLIATAAGSVAADTTFNDFLQLLVKNRRIDLIDLIAHSYLTLYREENNIRRVEIVSASPLEPAVMNRIKQLVEKQLDGAKMEFSSRVDPALIGGFVVNIDNERLDASISTQLKELKLSLLN